MGRLWTSVGTGLLLFAAFSSSSNYKLNNYSVGPAGTNNSHSANYYTQSTGGEAAGDSVNSTSDTGSGGSVQAEQLAVPQSPALSNDSDLYYNQLLTTLNDNAGTDNYPADVTFSIGVSTTDCFTSACVQSGAVKFVQTGGSLGGSEFYQSYSAWGGGSGTNITGLTSSTTYYVAVAARQGMFTNTEYGASASVATASPSVSFSVSPDSLSFSGLLPGTVYTSSPVTFGLDTNAVYGATVYNAGTYGGLHSSSKSAVIPALTGDLSSSTHGFGLQGTGTSQTSGGPITIASPYDSSGSTVGTESSSYAPTFTSSSPVTDGSATMNMQAKASASDPASNDYQEVMTFVAAASF